MAILVMLAMAVSACTGAPSPAPATGAGTAGPTPGATVAAPLKIGFIGVQSGDFAEFGKTTLQGTQLAAEDWNAKGGPGGRQIELLVEDDRFDPNQAVIVTQKLLDTGIDALIGAGASSTIIPSSLVLEGAHVVNIHAGSNPVITERGLKYNFRASPRDDVLQPYAADWAKRQGWTSVAILHDKTALGEGQAVQFKDAFEKLGGTTVTLYEGTTFGDTDFSGVLTKVKGTNPDFLYCGCNAPQSGNIVRQAKQLGAASQFLITDSGPTFDEVAGDARGGVYTVNNLGPNDIPGNEDWVARYKARWNNEDPSAFTVVYYAMSDVLFHAIDEAGTDPDALADYLHNLKGYQSVFGSITFDAEGDNVDAEIGIFKIPPTGVPYELFERRNDVVN
jgi:branched-chain amino acid transport system substrate-binding protein